MAYYTETNFKSKKALKAALAEGQVVKVWSPGATWFGHGGSSIKESESGPVQIFLEGPHYPKPHTWAASGMIQNGAIIAGTVK